MRGSWSMLGDRDLCAYHERERCATLRSRRRQLPTMSMRSSQPTRRLGMWDSAAALLAYALAQHPVASAAPPGSASRAIEAAPIPLTEAEALPPTGKGNLFSD